MLKIRRIYDNILAVNRDSLKQVQDILKSQFADVSREEIEKMEDKLRNPLKHRFRTIFLVAENMQRKVLGFAMLLHEAEIGFCYLDWIALSKENTGSGLGSALYDRVRNEAIEFESKGLFFECLPDSPETCPDRTILRQNVARLRFYEKYGARPIAGTAYETPIKDGDTMMPHLVFDGLDKNSPPKAPFVRKVVRAILERKYAEQCPPDYVDRVVRSIKEDPVKLRSFQYVKPEAIRTAIHGQPSEQIALVVNDKHDIHHIHEKGYVESPIRVKSIMKAIFPSGLFIQISPRSFPDKHIHAVHDTDLANYLKRACREMPENKSLYPYIFPIRNKTLPPKEPSVLAGYYCIDTFTPINRNAYPAARRGVDCTLTAADELLSGRRIAYALVRPPGHHAERRAFGGFCYFNNAAVAAKYLSSHGKVVILDIDYHHGNGQQDIFYRESDILTISIHCHPQFAYPYFTGFEHERGEGEGEGFNLNIPLPETVDGVEYRKELVKAIKRIKDFSPQFLIVALGLDTGKKDPTGTWLLTAKDFESNGRMIGELGLPTLVCQEGGYRNKTLGINAWHFFKGLSKTNHQSTLTWEGEKENLHGVTFREELQQKDPEKIRNLVHITGFFKDNEIVVAEELVRERLEKGESSGYFFVVAEHNGRMVGYSCFGPTPCTESSYDLYWIAVHPDFQRKGLGRRLIMLTEKRIVESGGKRIYIDTSQKEKYASTRAFYEYCGYRVEAILSDFYAPSDGKVIFCKVINSSQEKAL